MKELNPGSHYLMVVQRGTVSEASLVSLVAELRQSNIKVHVIFVYDPPSSCMAFTEQEVENG